MQPLYRKFSRSLQAGFIDHLRPYDAEYLPEILINEQSSGKKVLTTILHELRHCNEFWFSVAFVTKSGIATLINTLQELAVRGIRGRILVSQYLNFTQPEALKSLLQFRNIELKIAIKSDFHSKGYLFVQSDVNNLIIGSSNLTAGALCSNVEWNLKISAFSNSHVMRAAIKEFSEAFNNATIVDSDFIESYRLLFDRQFNDRRSFEANFERTFPREIEPNSMQREALANLAELRKIGKNKALLISATGTGKTYLAAFDAKVLKPRRLLFVVHRYNIAEAAMRTFAAVFGNTVKFGLLSGNRKDIDADFVFATVQTIAMEDILHSFSPDYFDYIVVDETHRAAAKSYTKFLEYFKPHFLLGMTATPERTDGEDVFSLFGHNIAYEIRLHQALANDMLSTFHYYGVTDISVNGELLSENTEFSLLEADERIDRIIEKSEFYGCDDGTVRGLVFARNIDECRVISSGFNSRGLKTVALTGESSDEARLEAISRLESDDISKKLDYIFTVEIFNEGIDIPRVNQIIMLRPTQSAIIFVQQLGRGLRKYKGKEYLTVIDFIGNYSNNYLVPVALYGDNSYNKDTLRRLMSSGSSLIPGSSTINFDKIARERIFNAIDSANMLLKSDLVRDYELLKFKLGRVPMMVDFFESGSRDPQLYADYSRSYFHFVKSREPEIFPDLSDEQLNILRYCASEINNSKRIEESIILRNLLHDGEMGIQSFVKQIKKQYGYVPTEATIESSIRSLNFEFVRKNEGGKILSVRAIHGISLVERNGDLLQANSFLQKQSREAPFRKFLLDNTQYSIAAFDQAYERKKYSAGFVLYRKYSRKDVFRILNWDTNPVAQTVGGYMISPDKTNCPIFVTYHKSENISESTKYQERFLNPTKFEWMSKSSRTLNSPEIKEFMKTDNKLRLPFFIQKSNDEGLEFYYLGDVTPIKNSFEQTTIPGSEGKDVSVVKVEFSLQFPVENSLFQYLCDNGA